LSLFRPCVREFAAILVCALALVALVPPATAQQAATIRNTYGEVGLLDMPSAHMANDGHFGLNMGDVGNYQRYSFFFQRWPWLETSFRYSRVPYWQGSKIYYDRSLGAKLRLFNERDDFADVSIGVRDALGTGVYGSEYLVASKHFGPLDLTAGLGWGRLAGDQVLPNPVGLVVHSFDTRKSPSSTGLVDFGEFFHGAKTGVFGGVAWQTPIESLSVLAEYSSDKYANEAAYKGGLVARSPVNVGLSYRPLQSLAISAGWYYGTTYGFTVSLIGDPTTTYPSAVRIGPPVPPPAIRNDAQQQSALALMGRRNGVISEAHSDGPWVAIPRPFDRNRQDLLQAFFSETHGVRNIDVDGKSLVIDASLQDDPRKQCNQYAQVAAANGAHSTTIAMTDLQNPDGAVTFCTISVELRPTAGAGQIDMLPGGAIDEAGLQSKISRDVIAQGIQVDALTVDATELWIYFENFRYRNESEAAGRIARLLMTDAPSSIEIFHLVPTRLGLPMQEITITRSGLERAIINDTVASGLGGSISLSAPPLDNPALDAAAHRRYPIFSWSLDPKLTQHLFDPNAPLQFLAYADADALLQLAPGLMLGTELTGTIWSNVTYSRPSNSALPHVRTDLLQYIRHGGYGISNLQVIYRTRLSSEVVAEARGGYLEDMFMGGGGQVLWRPEGSRLAFGADLYQVWKRGFDRLFDLYRDPVTGRGYNTLTGHVSVYYDSPWGGVNYALHVGRYLAGDYGGTLEISRRFASGVEIGAWATLTNVPFKKFGEGSFDKGIMIHIPFEWGLPIWSQSAYDLHLAALTRDGGQRLAGDDSLYNTTRDTSYGDISEHMDEIVQP
jgi:hypothetical protein